MAARLEGSRLLIPLALLLAAGVLLAIATAGGYLAAHSGDLRETSLCACPSPARHLAGTGHRPHRLTVGELGAGARGAPP